MVSPGKISPALAVACLLAAVPRAAPAQNISIDGRFARAQTLNAVGGNYSITPDLGKQVGSNLFHSFGKFGLNATEKATFSGPAATQNVIGRVTGGAQSNISGQIASTITGANLYLINPSGIVFGPNATVNVSGSFYASTANYLRMSDGAKFQATNPDASTLTMASPTAFGFMTATPAKIAVNGSVLAANGSALGPGTLGLVAGPVSISGPTPTVAPRANLSAPAGTIHVAAVAGPGEVPIDPRNTSALTVTSFGQVDINSRSTLTASTPAGSGSGGSVFIRSGVLTIDASTVAANNSGARPGGQLVMRGDSQIRLSNGTSVQAVTQGSGSGAEVTISTAPAGMIAVDASTLTLGSAAGSGSGGALSVQTGQLALTNGGAIASIAQAGGNGSPIAINADTIIASGGPAFNLATGIFSTNSSTASTAGGGAISIVAGELVLHNSANVLAGSCAARTCGPPTADTATPAGAGGAVVVSVGSLTADSGSSLGTVARGTGNAGNVSVTVAGPATIERGVGAPFSILDGIASTTLGAGNAGNVTVNAGSLTLINNGVVASTTSAGAAGNAGSVLVDVSGMLSIDGSGGFPPPNSRTGILGDTHSAGRGGDVAVTADGITVGRLGDIASDVASPGSGHGGNVTVAANNLKISNSGQISSSTFAGGDSGNVSIKVTDGLTIDGGGLATGIFSQANQGSTRNAGTVSLSAGSISIINNGQIAVGTFGAGDGGSISVAVAGVLTIDGAMAAGLFTGIASQANRGSTGNAGPISVSAGSISLDNNGKISSTTVGTGSAGQITVAAGALSIASNGQIASAGATGSSGKGGNIVVTVAGQLLIDGTQGDQTSLTGISTQSQGSGDGGSVLVKAGTLSIKHIGEISSSTFARGKGGTVAVAVDGLLAIDGSGTNLNLVPTGIVTDSRAGSSGNAGDVSVQAGALSIVSGGSISSALRPFMNLPASTGNSGSVAVNVGGLLSLSGSESRIGTETNSGSIGDAGSITVNAGQIALASGGQIVSTTAGTGAGGSVTVTTPGTLVLDGQGVAGTQIAASATGPNSGAGGSVTVMANTVTVEGGAQIASSTTGAGKGGDVDVVVASDITLPDRGPQITAQSTGGGDAGTITVSAARLLLSDGGRISTEAQTANGGNITLNVGDFLYLTNSQITASVSRETGNGGNIKIDPQLVILNHSSIIAQAAEGQGGNITINAGLYIASTDSVVSASSQFGVSGTVVINGPQVDVNSALVVLSSELHGLAAVSREACAARANQPVSSLVEAGRGGQPQDPEATLPALYIAGRDLNPTPASPGRTEASSAIQTTVRVAMHCG